MNGKKTHALKKMNRVELQVGKKNVGSENLCRLHGIREKNIYTQYANEIRNFVSVLALQHILYNDLIFSVFIVQPRDQQK